MVCCNLAAVWARRPLLLLHCKGGLRGIELLLVLLMRQRRVLLLLLLLLGRERARSSWREGRACRRR